MNELDVQEFLEQQLAIQYRVATILNESDDVAETASSVLSTICEIFNWAGGEVWAVDQITNVLRKAARWFENSISHSEMPIEEPEEVHINEGLLGHIWKTGSHCWIPDLKEDQLFLSKQLMLKSNLKSLFGVPIIAQQKVVGVMVFFNEKIPKPDFGFLMMAMSLAEQFGIFVKRKQLEKEQITLQEELQLQNVVLAEQKEFLLQANLAKTTFIANMTHELRTPLSIVIGLSELMYKGKVGAISESHREYLKEIITNANNQLHLIDDILDFTKIEAGQMQCHPEKTNLEKLVKEVADSTHILMEEKKLKFSISIDPFFADDVVVDPVKVKQILYNYLSNAIKFTQQNGKIAVSISLKNDNFFRLEVSDTGIGIDKKDLEKLFVLFQQFNMSHSKSYQGVGLGLALAHHIAEELGGSVGVVSEPGKGSTFYAILPFRRD